MGKAKVHVHAQFYQYYFSILGINRNIYAYTYTYTHTYTGHMTVMLENGGNFENRIPIPNYEIHLVLDEIPYDLKTKSNI